MKAINILVIAIMAVCLMSCKEDRDDLCTDMELKTTYRNNSERRTVLEDIKPCVGEWGVELLADIKERAIETGYLTIEEDGYVTFKYRTCNRDQDFVTTKGYLIDGVILDQTSRLYYSGGKFYWLGIGNEVSEVALVPKNQFVSQYVEPDRIESVGSSIQSQETKPDPELAQYVGKWQLFQVGNGAMKTATFNITISSNGNASVHHYAQEGYSDITLESGEGTATLRGDKLYIEITRGKSAGTTITLTARGGRIYTTDGESFQRH